MGRGWTGWGGALKGLEMLHCLWLVGSELPESHPGRNGQGAVRSPGRCLSKREIWESSMIAETRGTEENIQEDSK